MKIAAALSCLALGLAGCGGGNSGPPAVTSLALAVDYDAVVVSKVLADGISVSGLTAFEVSLTGLQSAGGQVVGMLERPDRGLSYALTGTFDAETGAVRFDAFEGALTSTQSERIDAVGGRADDAQPVDGLANTMTGFVLTSSTVPFETDGQFIAVARGEGLPELDLSQLIVSRPDLGTLQVEASAGFSQGSLGIEVFIYSAFEPQASFRVTQTIADGSLRPLSFDGLAGDVVVLRGLQAGRHGRAIFYVVPE